MAGELDIWIKTKKERPKETPLRLLINRNNSSRDPFFNNEDASTKEKNLASNWNLSRNIKLGNR